MNTKLIKDSIFEGRYNMDENPRFTNNVHSTTDNRNWYEKPENRVPKPVAPREKRVPLWNKKNYNQWIKDMAWFEGDEGDGDYGYEMAQNATHENGLLDYVSNVIKKQGGDEDPMERIQRDIEANMN